MTFVSILDGLGSIAGTDLTPDNSRTPISVGFTPQLHFFEFLLKFEEFPDGSFKNALGV